MAPQRKGLVKLVGLASLEMLTKYKTIDIFEFTKGYPGLQLFRHKQINLLEKIMSIISNMIYIT